MKKIILFALLTFTTMGFAQQNMKKQVSKKDVKNGLITFETFTNNAGDVSYGFRMGALIVGPNMIKHSDGKVTYQNYNKEHTIDGTVIIMDNQKQKIELYTYRDSKKEGPSFVITNGKPTATDEYKNDKIDLGGHKVKPPGKYVLIKGDGKSGFTMEKDDKGYAIGYFKYGYRQFPMIHVWNSGNSYYGQYLGGQRLGFGVFFFNDSTKYVGMFDEGYLEGLGFMVDKDGTITEKGYYDNGKLLYAID
ncbi:hypothetical protein [Flavobacterium sp.]|uniref:hypothetical protein n=1 Tax=Flavobacterium sp. TaxID=239 RepID=UPI003528CAA6